MIQKNVIKSRYYVFFERFLGLFEQLFLLVVCIILTITVFLVFLSVLGRVFNFSAAWTFEIIEYSIVYITFLSASWILKKDAHVQVDLITSYVSERTQKILMVAIYGVVLICSAVLFWHSSLITIDHFQKGVIMQTVIRPPKFLVLLPIPLGFFLLFLRSILKISKYIFGYKVNQI